MVSSGRRAIVCILLLLSLVVSARSQSAVDKAETATITGKVTVGDKGLQGVVVALVISDQQSSNFRPTRFRSTTDEDGKYRITNVTPGAYTVVPASPAYVAIEGRKSLLLGKNETVENVDIALARGGVITGKVTDEDGNPIIEEMISVSAVKTTHRVMYYRDIRTDDRGIYRAYGLPEGKYTVAAGRDGVSYVGNRRSEAGFQRTYHPSTVDAAAATVIDVNDGSEATNVDITLRGPARTFTARGRIIDSETDKPVPNTRVGVQMSIQYGTSAMGNVAESSKDGEFKVENLAPGKYAVYSEPPAGADWHSEAVPFEVTDRDVEGLVIKTSRGSSISGVVILEGTDDAKVRASLLAGRIVGQIVDGSYLGRPDPSSTIDPNGSFRMTGLAPGRLMFELQPQETFWVIRVERGGIPFQGNVEIKEHEQVTGLRVVVGHANGAIRGVIKLPIGLELPTGARLSVHFRRTDDPNPGSRPVDVDTRGQFRVERLIPGTYEIDVRVFINASPSRIPPARQTVIVTSGAAADVTITLQMPKPSPQ